MITLLMLLLFCTLPFAHITAAQFDMVGENMEAELSHLHHDRVFIDSVGDIRAIMGPWKNIIVC